jgi:hypothetical protein
VHAPELGRNDAEHAQLAGDPLWPKVASARGVIERIGMDQLPDPRNQVRRVLRQEGVQKGGTRARKPGDEDRSLDRLIEDVGPASLFLAQPQQVGQEAHRIPVCREAPEEGQIPLLSAGTQKFPQRLLEGRVAEIG